MDQSFPPAARMRVLTYDGRVGEIYGIFLLNILFTILTLGIWRFWAITPLPPLLLVPHELRRRAVRVYRDRRGELFVGFLLAGLMLIGAAVVAGLLSFALCRPCRRSLAVIPVVLLYGFVVVLGRRGDLFRPTLPAEPHVMVRDTRRHERVGVSATESGRCSTPSPRSQP